MSKIIYILQWCFSPPIWQSILISIAFFTNKRDKLNEFLDNYPPNRETIGKNRNCYLQFLIKFFSLSSYIVMVINWRESTSILTTCHSNYIIIRYLWTSLNISIYAEMQQFLLDLEKNLKTKLLYRCYLYNSNNYCCVIVISVELYTY